MSSCIIHDTRVTVPSMEPVAPWTVRRLTISTDHPSSSYGQPVLVGDGYTLGPGDLPEWAVVAGIATDDTEEPPFDLMTCGNEGDPYYEWIQRQAREREALAQALRSAGYRLAYYA